MGEAAARSAAHASGLRGIPSPPPPAAAARATHAAEESSTGLRGKLKCLRDLASLRYRGD